MPLPSQSPRQMLGFRTPMMRRSRRRSVPMAVVGVAAVLGVALLYVVVRPLFGSPSTAGGAEVGSGDGAARAENPSHTPTLAPRNEASRPAEPQRRPDRQASNAASTQANPSGNTTRPGAPTNTGATTPVSATPAQEPGSRETPREAPIPSAASESSSDVATALRAAEAEAEANRPTAAREVLLRALARTGVSDRDAARLRDRIGALNDEILFSPRQYPDDPITESYRVQGGDSLSRIAGRQGLGVDWRLIQRINAMGTTNIREGQTLKLIRGPFHAVVDKSDYRLDLYAGPPDSINEWVFIRSFRVGLGEGDGTPVGDFVVKRNSRLINPVWVNPRNGQRFAADDPENPIGERWIGIRGVGDSVVHEGFGIHGTIEPDSIGQQRSMGCVRMLSGDVELVYEMLAEEISRVLIVP
ncbi:MAG: LysM peptidoglycan-binding domain-containing protein [Phycisphaerales bacterium]|nr:LysM peptidoglycan-binding domain-containing protein [Phycisphaerales bacterium]